MLPRWRILERQASEDFFFHFFHLLNLHPERRPTYPQHSLNVALLPFDSCRALARVQLKQEIRKTAMHFDDGTCDKRNAWPVYGLNRRVFLFLWDPNHQVNVVLFMRHQCWLDGSRTIPSQISWGSAFWRGDGVRVWHPIHGFKATEAVQMF